MYVIGPLVGLMIGSVLGTQLKLNDKTIHILKAIVGGIVLAAVSTRLVPDIVKVDQLKRQLLVLFGIFIGAGTMFAMRKFFTQKLSKSTKPWEMITSVAIDFFISSFIIGMALSLGDAGPIMAIALGLEITLISVAISSRMKETGISRGKIVGIVSILALIILVGYFAGALISAKFKNTGLYYFLLSISIAALLWIIFEELLADTRDHLGSRLSAGLIISGFMFIIAAGWVDNYIVNR